MASLPQKPFGVSATVLLEKSENELPEIVIFAVREHADTVSEVGGPATACWPPEKMEPTMSTLEVLPRACTAVS